LPLVLVIIPDILSTIMSLVQLVTLPETCHTSCGDTLFLYTYILHSINYVSCILCRHCHCI